MLDGSERILSHARPEDVAGKRVIGVLPLRLAALTAEVVEVPLRLTAEDRGRGEIDLEQMREIAGEAQTYRVWRVPESAL